jgi:hypothetical protein
MGTRSLSSSAGPPRSRHRADWNGERQGGHPRNCDPRALRASATDRFTLMGWGDDPWLTASGEAEALERALFETFMHRD